ncbi:MAG: hypothetical protein SPG41_08660 [Erysipelotrichaceae bacterium]|nr:hypothetical protein [Solobacterium sp.]MDD7776501.1 hypothetical protein [Solobacterium sp.]MDY2952202.1 hypothetical protein [Erysipelotrichaceae bacterium]MDY4792317.1 hypothetical protein [Erysipelotrichaceae bacterium]MDY5402665.1 hypothetical protein [Erysipelotrichaceae bacterium]
MTTKTDNSNITNNIPSEELLESLKEIEDYKNGDIELDTYEDAKEMRVSLLDD